jgi:hypothetical protein
MGDGEGRRGEGEELTIMGMLLGSKWLIYQPLSFPFDVCLSLFGMGWGRRRRRKKRKRRRKKRREIEELTIMGMLLGCKWLIHQPLSFLLMSACLSLEWGRRRKKKRKRGRRRRGEGEELTIMGMLLESKWLIHQSLSFLLMSSRLSLEWGRRREEEKERNSP